MRELKLTPRQAEIVALKEQGISITEIGKRLGIARQSVQSQLMYVERKVAALSIPPAPIIPPGYHLSSLSTTVDKYNNIRSQSYRVKSGEEGDLVPDSGTFPAPDGMYVRSVSTLVDGQTGVVKQQWVKADIDNEVRKAAQEAAFRAMCEKLAPLDIIAAPVTRLADLLTLYTLTDSHVGMLAWGRETGEAWNLEIAERVLVETLIRMIDAAPASATAIVNQLGDFLHFDSLQPLTPANHHVLDADSRYQKVVEVAVRILRRVIEYALVKHDRVLVYMHEGNHDPAGSVWLRVMFAQLYEKNPRVVVEQSPNPYVAMQHGKTMLAFHHGHLVKALPSLPLIFAEKYASMWGTTEYRYCHTGHKHNVEEKEHPGMKVVQHPTLASPDAYAARYGFLSKRQATSMTYHVSRGEVARGIFIPE